MNSTTFPNLFRQYNALRIKWPPNNETSATLVRSCTTQQVTIEYHSSRIESEREGQRTRKGFCLKIAFSLSHDWRIRQNSQVTEYLTGSHVKIDRTLSSTNLLSKHFVLEFT
jgi:hypothetical protein